ncbi:MAG TPA: hypothetical protein PKI32_08835, partial [Opitutales bacterium]|nr:hypothetical protein [Opitutales bacterium]
ATSPEGSIPADVSVDSAAPVVLEDVMNAVAAAPVASAPEVVPEAPVAETPAAEVPVADKPAE